MHDAYALSALILEDHYAPATSAGPLPTEPERNIPDALRGAHSQVVDLAGWKAIDQAERNRAKRAGSGKEREKFRKVKEMLAVIQ